MSEKNLTKDHFDKHPVWKWDDEMEGHEPVDDFDPLPEDEATLFIRARFIAASGERFRGYLIGSESFYAVGLFVDDEQFVLNLNLPDMMTADAMRIRSLVTSPDLQLFPLQYEDDVKFEHSPRLRGELDP